MLVRIYKVTGSYSRSVIAASLVAEVVVDELPEDEAAFASDYGGDFIEIIAEEPLVA